MSSHHPEPLSTEERELAQRLARVGLPGEPSPALDARILAVAHDAVAKRSTQTRRGRRRWKVAFGVAASLALAVGIAWQLRPLPQAPPAYDEGAAAMVEIAAADSAQPGAAGDSAAKALSPAESDPVQSARVLSPAVNEEDMQAEASSAGGEPAASASAVEQPSIVFDQQPQPVDAQIPQPAPPPPAAAASASPEFVPPPPAPSAPSAPATVTQQRENAVRTTSSQQRPLSGAAAPARGAEAKDASTLDTITAADGSEEGFDERPPSTADSPEVQQAWLQRIRELIADGESDAARDSLQEFKRRHPGVVLPDDLRRFDRPL
ncbi:MAG: hypothetical protein LH470_11440 [Lysobacter sp.]|nr:hypothetical protein [Lysobacter sp.]